MNAEQFNQCVEQYADRLFRFAFSSLRNREQAEDVVQESFARVWEKRKTVDFAKAKSYLFTTAHHAMVDEVRQRMQTSDLNDLATLTNPKGIPHSAQGLSHLARVAASCLALARLRGLQLPGNRRHHGDE